MQLAAPSPTPEHLKVTPLDVTPSEVIRWTKPEPISALEEQCLGDDCPFRVGLSYAYALDREEVSMRAYRQCVEAGCCEPPAGRLWTHVSELAAAGPLPRRPSSPPTHPSSSPGVQPIDDGVGAVWPSGYDEMVGTSSRQYLGG